MPTAGDLRSNAEKIADEELKERILKGIGILERNVGPDWVDMVDPMTLNLASARFCVLGQVFSRAEPTEEQWTDFLGEEGLSTEDEDGFSKGRAILGDRLGDPGNYGFDRYDENYAELTRAWRSLWPQK